MRTIHKIELALLVSLATVLAIVPAVQAQAMAAVSSAGMCNECTCYVSSDCSSGETCGDYFTCTKKGKLDGVCKSSGVSVWSTADLSAAADAVDAYFDAFYEASRDTVGGGAVSAEQWLRIAHSQRLSVEGHAAVRSLTLDALDLAIGFDLVHENLRLCPSTGSVPLVRGVMSEEADALVAAVRQGLVDAIRFNDSSLIEAPIRSFWAQNPAYEPHHTGRGYDHGHPSHPYASPGDCQVIELRALADLYLPGLAAGGSATLAPK